MEAINLQAETREAGKGPARQARRAGFIPAILYGKGKEALPLKVPAREFSRVLSTGAGRNNLIRLRVAGEKGENERMVMIKELQQDPVDGSVLHADFYQVSLKEKIRALVPLAVAGEELVARAGNVVQHQLREVEVECLPTRLPDHLTVNVAGLRAGEHLSVGDLRAPEGVKILTPPEEIIAAVVATRHVEDEAGAPETGEPETAGKKETKEE